MSEWVSEWVCTCVARGSRLTAHLRLAARGSRLTAHGSFAAHACVFTLRFCAARRFFGRIFALCGGFWLRFYAARCFLVAFLRCKAFFVAFSRCKAFFRCVFALQGVFTLRFCAARCFFWLRFSAVWRFLVAFLRCKAFFGCVFTLRGGFAVHCCNVLVHNLLPFNLNRKFRWSWYWMDGEPVYSMKITPVTIHIIIYIKQQ